MVPIKKSSGKTAKGPGSNKAHARTYPKINPSYNNQYVQNKPLWENVCKDSTPINDYMVDGKLPAIKYKFTGSTLEIHIYAKFVTYIKTGDFTYNKVNNPTYKTKGKSCITLIKQGISSAYGNQYIGGSKNDFNSKVAFKTKVIFHSNGNPGQKFIEARIGNDSPRHDSNNNVYAWATGSKNHWFFMTRDNVDPFGHTACFFMATNSQLANNANPNQRKPISASQYKITTAHEMGHIFGLGDAYPTHVDRCADNAETTWRHGAKEYDNLMKWQWEKRTALPNDIEMMLKAYQAGKGEPWSDDGFQYYKTYPDSIISEVIKNRRDYQNDLRL